VDAGLPGAGRDARARSLHPERLAGLRDRVPASLLPLRDRRREPARRLPRRRRSPAAAYDAGAPPPAKLAALCRKYHVRRLGLFGSAARGELAPESDVDLLVEFEPGSAPSFWAEPELREAFGKLFGGRRVDLVPPAVLENPYRRRSILRDLKVLYEA
jgi:uncharacterized protein